MAVGIQPSLAQLNAQAGQIVINARESLQDILFFYEYLQALGSAGLVSQYGMVQADADTMIGVFTNLAAIAQVCMGESYDGPALPFNFLAESAAFWGGQ